jgi:hypothetical protein
MDLDYSVIFMLLWEEKRKSKVTHRAIESKDPLLSFNSHSQANKQTYIQNYQSLTIPTSSFSFAARP